MARRFELACAVMLASLLLGSCSKEEVEPKAVTVDKLTLVYQTILEWPFSLGGGDIQYQVEDVNNRTQLKVSLGNPNENIIVSPTKDKCKFNVEMNYSGRVFQAADIDIDRVYLGNPNVFAGDGGWFFGQVQFEDDAITNFQGPNPITALGARLDRGAESDVSMWKSRLSALKKHCAGR